MTCIDKNGGKTSSRVGKTGQQKRHLLQGAFSNGGSNRTRIPDLLQISPRVRRWWRQKRPVWP